MKPKVFVAQPIPEVALDILREAAGVTVCPYLDRQISVDELVANAKRSDWLFVLHETPLMIGREERACFHAGARTAGVRDGESKGLLRQDGSCLQGGGRPDWCRSHRTGARIFVMLRDHFMRADRTGVAVGRAPTRRSA
jgi:hypothetical protein